MKKIIEVADIVKEKRDPTKEPDTIFQYVDISTGKIHFTQAQRWEQRINDRGIDVAHVMSSIDCRDVLRQADCLMLNYDDRDTFREIVRIGGEACLSKTRALLDAGMRIIQSWWFYSSPSAGRSPEI